MEKKSFDIQIFPQKKLHTLTMEAERLESEISSRQELQSRIQNETQLVEVV